MEKLKMDKKISGAFKQEATSKRFLELVEWLKKNKKIKSYSAFLRDVDYPTQSFNNIKKGTQNIPLKVISKAALITDVDTYWLLTGRGQMFIVLKDQADHTEDARKEGYAELQDNIENLLKRVGKLEKKGGQKLSKEPEGEKGGKLGRA